jgi:hypothetical protein
MTTNRAILALDAKSYDRRSVDFGRNAGETTKAARRSLRGVTDHRNIAGNTLNILGICDMVEEYWGVDRETFVKEIGKTRVILDAAIEMWHKKEYKMAEKHYKEQASTYDEMVDMSRFYVGLYDLCNDGVAKYDKKLFQTFVYNKSIMYAMYNDDEPDIDDGDYEAYMNEQWEEIQPDYDY